MQASSKSSTLEVLLVELRSFIGLDTVKADVESLISAIQVDRRRRSLGLKVTDRSLHLVFEGNPGTGKTTIARILASIYKELGILGGGQLVCTDRAGLVGRYIGHTAQNVEEVAQRALGGVLFIDEAYSLAPPFAGNDFGPEAIQKLLLMMENHRDELIVIVAGYPSEMERFLDANPGLRSRFTKTLHFADYSPDQLVSIFQKLCAENDYILEDQARKKLKLHLKVLYVRRDRTFGNGRLARNLFEEATTNLSRRIVSMHYADRSALMLIREQDIPEGPPGLNTGAEGSTGRDENASWSINPVDSREKRTRFWLIHRKWTAGTPYTRTMLGIVIFVAPISMSADYLLMGRSWLKMKEPIYGRGVSQVEVNGPICARTASMIEVPELVLAVVRCTLDNRTANGGW